jgi:hypothetical protein
MVGAPVAATDRARQDRGTSYTPTGPWFLNLPLYIHAVETGVASPRQRNGASACAVVVPVAAMKEGGYCISQRRSESCASRKWHPAANRVAEGDSPVRTVSDQEARASRRRTHSAAVVLLSVLAYLAVTMPRLGVSPPVGEDEPWIAAAPYKLATQGVLGSDLFAGYYGMEPHHYAHMPIYPPAQAGIFKAFGVGVVQMRALPVACGLLLLAVVFLVGRQAGGDRVGALAVALMVTLRVSAGGAATGILLLDRARINRYDIARSGVRSRSLVGVQPR